MEEGRRIDFISLSGSGEPTLSADIGEIIREHEAEDGDSHRGDHERVAALQGGRGSDIAAADVVLPSLDATGDAVFQRINRPHPALSFDRLVEGLRPSAVTYKGKIWLEIMLIKGINNSTEELKIFKQIVSGLSADKVQLNTVARPPLEETARGLDGAELLSRIFRNGCEIIPAT